jgi:hypothetical protein
MTSEVETLLTFEGFEAWNWETEFRQALNTHRPGANDAAVGRMRLRILREFVDFVREIVSLEFGLGLRVSVDGLTAEGIVGRVDFAAGRRAAITGIEGSIPAWRHGPTAHRTMPILDQLLLCVETARAPDRLDSELGGLKRECLAHFRRDGSISRAVDGADDGPSEPAPVPPLRAKDRECTIRCRPSMI